MNATISRRNARPKPPDKGSFPLDHEGIKISVLSVFYCFGALLVCYFTGECKEYMKQYMQCLKQCKNDNHECRSQSQQYLQCRMDK